MPGQPSVAGASTAGASNVTGTHTFNDEFYYIMLNNVKEVVMANGNYIN